MSGSGSAPDADALPVIPLPSIGSGINRPPRANSETVIHQGNLAALTIPPNPESPSSQLMLRLFPPSRDSQVADLNVDPAGVELGHFRIEERIGMGGMGSVFRAVDTRLQRYVALKLLSPGQVHDSAAVKRFENEARAAARLDHENIARVHFIGEERGLHFIAFEYVTGSNVREMIRRSGRISPADTVNYALQIAYALKHTSAMGVVHRDIKPSNIIITLNGRAKLVDLGLARKEHTESGADLTMSGTTLGTFDYISPEQAKDPRSVDVRSDIYSLGCTLYHMLTGQPPYPDGTALQKLLDHQGKDAPNPTALNSQVSDELSGIVRRMMNSDRTKRYQTPEQLIRDLSHAAGTMGLRGVHPEGLVWVSSQSVMPRSWKSQIGWIATVVILLAFVGILQTVPQIARQLTGVEAPSTNQIEPPTTSGTGPQPPTPATVPIAAAEKDSDAAAPTSKAVAAIQGPASKTPLVTNDNNDAVEVPSVSKPNSGRPMTSPAIDVAVRDPSASGTTIASTGSKPPPPTRPMTSKTDPATGTAATPATTSGSTASSTDVSSELPSAVAVYTQSGAMQREYRTLEAACLAAEDGSVIELRYSGRRLEKPCRIAKKNVTIRAAKGHVPIVHFLPVQADSSTGKVRFLTLQSGPVSVVNVQFEVEVPKDGAAQEYAIFGLTQPTQLQLSGVAMTFLNPKQLPCSVVSIGADQARPGSDMPRMPLMSFGENAVAQVEAIESLVRGNASFVSLDCSSPIQLVMKDSAFALGQDAIAINSLAGTTPEKAQCTIRMEHVTLVSRGSFLRFNGVGQGENRISVHCNARNSVFQIGSNVPLIQMESSVAAEDSRRVFAWSGERNFYSDVKRMWMIGSTGEVLNFEQWLDQWGPASEVGPNNDVVSWAESLPDDLSQVRAIHFGLDASEGSGNSAVAGATDGSDAGSNPRKLPELENADDADENDSGAVNP